jgi:hypothetical protein
MVLSGFFDSIGLYTQPSVSQKNSFSVKLVHLNHLFSLKHFQLDSKDCLLYVP